MPIAETKLIFDLADASNYYLPPKLLSINCFGCRRWYRFFSRMISISMEPLRFKAVRESSAHNGEFGKGNDHHSSVTASNSP
jgi:hypothetical protein